MTHLHELTHHSLTQEPKRYLAVGQWLGTGNHIVSLVFNTETGGWEATTSNGSVFYQEPNPDSYLWHYPDGLRTWDVPTDGRTPGVRRTPWPPKPYPRNDDDTADTDTDDQEPTADAWKRMDDLRRETTRSWDVRPDISVDALGTERCVRLTITERPSGPFDITAILADRRGNVVTMRELAHTLLAACDFVEQVNPTWAKHAPYPADPDTFLLSDDDDD